MVEEQDILMKWIVESIEEIKAENKANSEVLE